MQLVLLSGTVPPPSEKSLKKAFGLTSNAITIRQQTNRPELQYLWQPACKSNAQLCSTVYHIIQEYAKEFKPEDRTLVFVPYLKTGDELAKFLGCKFYKGKDMEKDERNQVYLNWRLGVDKTMICTSSFGAGNDYPSVRLIIHAGTPLEMIGYIQESSCGGRDKQLTRCFIVPQNTQKPILSPDKIDHKGQEAAWKTFVHPPLCFQQVFSEFNDGIPVMCADLPNAIQCGQCQKNKNKQPSRKKYNHISSTKAIPKPPPIQEAGTIMPNSNKRKADQGLNVFEQQFIESKHRKVAQGENKRTYIDTFKATLFKVKGLCAYCLIHRSYSAHHSILKCPTLKNSTHAAVGNYLDWRGQLKYNERHHDKVCWFCHIPQCHEQLHPPFQPNATDCEYEDIIAPIGYALYSSLALRLLMQERMHTTWDTVAVYIKWLNGPPVQGHETNLSALFLDYINNVHTF